MDVDPDPDPDHATFALEPRDTLSSTSTPATLVLADNSNGNGNGNGKRKYDDYRSSSDTPPVSTPSSPRPHAHAHAHTTAQRVLLERTAPHLLDRPRAAHPHHTVPPGFRGPAPRPGDAEDIAPAPTLLPVPGSATLYTTTNSVINRNGWKYTAAGPASHQLPLTVYRTLETLPRSIHWCWSDRSAFTKISADAHTISTDKGFRSARTNVGVRQGTWYVEVHVLPPEPGVPHFGDGPHVRVGWARREAPLNAPAGFDGYSYAYRDRTGDKVTLSRCEPYGKPFGPGDVVGMLITLPPEREPVDEDEDDPANIRRERVPIRYKGQLWFEALEYPQTREMHRLIECARKGQDADTRAPATAASAPAPTAKVKNHKTSASGSASGSGSGTGGKGKGRGKGKGEGKGEGEGEGEAVRMPVALRALPRLAGSSVSFYLNGEAQGVAFTELFDYRPLRVGGMGKRKRNRENVYDDGALGYFPIASVYGGARARLVTGEAGGEGMRFPLPQGARPLCERYEEHVAEMWKHDLADEARAVPPAHDDDDHDHDHDHDSDGRGELAQPRTSACKPLESPPVPGPLEQHMLDSSTRKREDTPSSHAPTPPPPLAAGAQAEPQPQAMRVDEPPAASREQSSTS